MTTQKKLIERFELFGIKFLWRKRIQGNTVLAFRFPAEVGHIVLLERGAYRFATEYGGYIDSRLIHQWGYKTIKSERDGEINVVVRFPNILKIPEISINRYMLSGLTVNDKGKSLSKITQTVISSGRSFCYDSHLHLDIYVNDVALQQRCFDFLHGRLPAGILLDLLRDHPEISGAGYF